MGIQKELESFKTVAIAKGWSIDGETTQTNYRFYSLTTNSGWEMWQAAKAQAVPYEPGSFKSSHEIIINETKSELIDGYDIAKEDEYLLESLVYRGVCIGKAQAVPEVMTIGNELQSWVAVWSFSAKNDGEDYVVVDANLLAEKIERLTGANQ